MKMNIQNILAIAIYIIIFIKVVFLVSTIGHLLLRFFKITSPKSKDLDTKFIYLKSKTEFIFTILMAILLIFIFSPRHNNQKYITKEIGILFYLFGLILIITANWSDFFKEAKWFKSISNAIKL